jgi:hypothetical protein
MTSDASVPEWATKGEFSAITRTADELCLVCPASNLPPDVHSESHWICLKLEGPYPVSATGIIIAFIEPLSDNGIPVFVISAYDTDYVLIQEDITVAANALLDAAGHKLVSKA